MPVPFYFYFLFIFFLYHLSLLYPLDLPASAFLIFKNIFERFYLFIQEKGREGERRREILMCSISCLSHFPKKGSSPQPRHVP